MQSPACQPGYHAHANSEHDMRARACRAGLKLEAALEHWAVDVRGLRCLDAGVSTGGFTDCLLQRGAAHVVGVDVGYGQVASTVWPVLSYDMGLRSRCVQQADLARIWELM